MCNAVSHLSDYIFQSQSTPIIMHSKVATQKAPMVFSIVHSDVRKDFLLPLCFSWQKEQSG